MAGRSNRNRHHRHRRRGAKLVSEPSDSSSPPQSSVSQQITEENPDLRRRTRDARAVRPFLMGLIRSYYIDAISRLPAAELRTTLARGFLVGGHCYGLLHPVLNIIVNSVWYAAAFPFRAADSDDPIDVDVITSEGITRLVDRSLDGLAAYLRHRCPALSQDDALWHLSLSHATVHGAAASARGAVSLGRMELEAAPFQVAAQAARHPKPAALALFATSALPAVERDALSLLARKRRLSSDDILRLSSMLQPLPLPDEVQPWPCPPEVSVRIDRIIAQRSSWRQWYQTLLDIADAALRKFARQTGARYRLHTTYGQNILHVRDWPLDRYFHINFMSWPKGKQNQSQIPVHFLAEAHKPPPTNCSEEDITLCCMLVHAQGSPSHVDNCYAYAKSERKINHPNGEGHFGGHPHKTDETKDGFDYPSTIDVDYRFFDPDRDIDLVKWYADKITRADAIYSKLRSDHPKCRFREDDDDDEEVREDDDDDEEVTVEHDYLTFCTRSF